MIGQWHTYVTYQFGFDYGTAVRNGNRYLYPGWLLFCSAVACLAGALAGYHASKIIG
jgi:hypothetical protein